MNAFTVEMCAELVEALTLANRDDAVQVIVVTGAGTVFCAGRDLTVAGNVFGFRGIFEPDCR